MEVAPGITATFCSLDDLIKMKYKAGRPLDMEDIAQKNLRERPMKNSPEDQEPVEERRWEHGWDEHERMQLRRPARLALSEKLLWIEQAQRVANQLQASRSAPLDTMETEKN